MFHSGSSQTLLIAHKYNACLYNNIILCKLLAIMSLFMEKCTTSIHGSSHSSTSCIYCYLFVRLFLSFDYINASLPQSLWQASSRCPRCSGASRQCHYLIIWLILMVWNQNKVWLSASVPAHQHQTKDQHFHCWFHCNNRCQLTFQRTGKKPVWCQRPAVNMF